MIYEVNSQNDSLNLSCNKNYVALDICANIDVGRGSEYFFYDGLFVHKPFLMFHVHMTEQK